MTLTDRVDPGFYFYNGNTAIYPAGEADKPEFLQKPIGLGPFKFVEHVPGSRLVAERWEKFYKPGMPYADRVVIAIMGEAPARDIAFRNKEIDLSILGPGAIRRLPRGSEPEERHPRGRRRSSRATWE